MLGELECLEDCMELQSPGAEGFGRGTTSRVVVGLPEVSLRESSSGTGFQITFETLGLLYVREDVVGDELPGLEGRSETLLGKRPAGLRFEVLLEGSGLCFVCEADVRLDAPWPVGLVAGTLPEL